MSGRSVAERLRFVVAVFGLLVGWAAPAGAQAIEDEFSVQRFNPAPGPRNFVTTRGARTDGEMAVSAGLFVNYSFEPFIVARCIDEDESCEGDNRTEIPIVENMITGDVLASLTPIPRLQLGLRVPITWVKGQGITAQGTADPEGLQAVGLGDVELEGKLRLYGDAKDPFVLGLSAFATGPFGSLTSEGSYIGDSTPSFGGRVIADLEQGPIGVGANLGGVWRGAGRIDQTELGPELRYGVAAGYRFSPVVRVVLDGFGSTNLSNDPGVNAFEADLGLQVQPLDSPLMVSAGAGGGIAGIGVPTVRAFLGVAFVFEHKDRDDDGIVDDQDQCPTEAEDLDGYEDGDGCPDPDNDLDAILDSVDKCPREPEDFDGFEDTDGCPDDDNDKDGIPDVSDRCPLEPETKNGFQDEDGCPDVPDTDGDGVPDHLDQCPDEVEDTDGFQDTDGCPDPDNDNDGILDIQDECIDEPETVNGFEDEDGCPDEAPAPPGRGRR